jgi:hypothetical protein
LKLQDYENGYARRGAEVKPSATTAGADDRTDDCSSGADDVAVPAKVQISTFSNDQLSTTRNDYFRRQISDFVVSCGFALFIKHPWQRSE